jgi:hypothetical protein
MLIFFAWAWAPLAMEFGEILPVRSLTDVSVRQPMKATGSSPLVVDSPTPLTSRLKLLPTRKSAAEDCGASVLQGSVANPIHSPCPTSTDTAIGYIQRERMTMMKKKWLLLLVAVVPLFCSAFTTAPSTTRRSSFTVVPSSSTTRLSVGPLQKLTNKKEYNTVVEGLMRNKGYTREQAEKEYNMYLDNPNDYALQKVSESMPTRYNKTDGPLTDQSLQHCFVRSIQKSNLGRSLLQGSWIQVAHGRCHRRGRKGGKG